MWSLVLETRGGTVHRRIDIYRETSRDTHGDFCFFTIFIFYIYFFMIIFFFQ